MLLANEIELHSPGNQTEQAVQLQLKKKRDELTGQTEFYSHFFSLNFGNLI